MLNAHRTVTSPLRAIGLGYMRGAISAVPADHTAFAHREASWLCDIIASWTSPEDDAGRHVGWARQL